MEAEVDASTYLRVCGLRLRFLLPLLMRMSNPIPRSIYMNILVLVIPLLHARILYPPTPKHQPCLPSSKHPTSTAQATYQFSQAKSDN